jgi:hypothetical protein
MSGFGDGRELATGGPARRIYGTGTDPGGRNLAHKQRDSAADVFDLLAFQCLLVRWMSSHFKETTWS